MSGTFNAMGHATQTIAKRRRKSRVRDEVERQAIDSSARTRGAAIDRLDPRPVKVHGRVMWQVDLGNVIRNGKPYRQRRTFASRAEAKTFSQLKIIERSNLGTRGIALSDYLRLQALEADRLLASYPGLSIMDCVREAVGRRDVLERSETVGVAYESFLRARGSDGLRPRYLGDLRQRLGRFVRRFHDRKLADLSSAEIDEYIRELGGSAFNRNTVRGRLSVFFEYARQHGWVGVNPITDVPKAKVASVPPAILTPDQAARLLEAASEEILPYFALGLFAGLRSAELERLRWEHLKWDENLIEVPALSSKTASRRLVTLAPNLLKWLEPYHDRRGPICPPNWRRHAVEDRRRAGIHSWGSNCLRHSFASYHLAAFRDAPALSLELGHMRPQTVFAFYRELVRPADARAFWSIAPAIGSPTITAVA